MLYRRDAKLALSILQRAFFFLHSQVVNASGLARLHCSTAVEPAWLAQFGPRLFSFGPADVDLPCLSFGEGWGLEVDHCSQIGENLGCNEQEGGGCGRSDVMNRLRKRHTSGETDVYPSSGYETGVAGPEGGSYDLSANAARYQTPGRDGRSQYLL